MRSANTWTACRPIRKKILANPDMSVKTRTFLAEAVLCTKQFFNAQIWTQLAPSDLSVLNTSVMRIYKPIAASALRYDFST